MPGQIQPGLQGVAISPGLTSHLSVKRSAANINNIFINIIITISYAHLEDNRWMLDTMLNTMYYGTSSQGWCPEELQKPKGPGAGRPGCTAGPDAERRVLPALPPWPAGLMDSPKPRSGRPLRIGAIPQCQGNMRAHQQIKVQ